MICHHPGLINGRGLLLILFVRVFARMKEFFNNDSLIDSINEMVVQDDFVVQEPINFNNKAAVKPMTHRRQIEILRENKMLMSSLKDVYDY